VGAATGVSMTSQKITGGARLGCSQYDNLNWTGNYGRRQLTQGHLNSIIGPRQSSALKQPPTEIKM